MPLNGTKLTLTVTGDLVLSDGFVEGHAAMNKIYSTILANGVGAGQADRRYHKTRTLAASATEDLDLAGVLTDVYGAVLTFARVKALIVAAAAANANNVIVGGAAATQFLSWVGAATHTVTVRPGGVLALIAGVGDSVGYVAGAGADFLRIGNGGAGTSVTYDITVIGCSA
jgi:hypothetical protein